MAGIVFSPPLKFCSFTSLMSDLQEVGSEICKIAELFNFQQGIIDQTLADLITDYNGIILTIPVRTYYNALCIQ